MNAGDKVRVEGSEGQYAITSDGSEGIVERIDGRRVYVKFDKLTGNESEVNRTFDVNIEHLKVIQQRTEQQRREVNQLTVTFGDQSLSFSKDLVKHQTVDELFDRFCRAYNVEKPPGYKTESDLGIVYSGLMVVTGMPAETSELKITEEDIEMPYGRAKNVPHGYEPVTEDDGEKVYKDTRTDTVVRAGITKDELDAVIDILETVKDIFEEHKDAITSFIAKGNAL